MSKAIAMNLLLTVHQNLSAGWQGHIYDTVQLETSKPDLISAKAMVRCLFYLVKRLVWLQKTIRSAQLNLAGSRRAVAKKTHEGSQITVPHDIAVSADQAEGKIGNAKDMLGMCLFAMHSTSVSASMLDKLYDKTL